VKVEEKEEERPRVLEQRPATRQENPPLTPRFTFPEPLPSPFQMMPPFSPFWKYGP